MQQERSAGLTADKVVQVLTASFPHRPKVTYLVPRGHALAPMANENISRL